MSQGRSALETGVSPKLLPLPPPPPPLPPLRPRTPGVAAKEPEGAENMGNLRILLKNVIFVVQRWKINL